MLKISRPDVSSSEIEEFATSERFLKIPIENYLGLIKIDPIGPQCALINAVNNPKYRFIVACLARRTGKTYIANIIAQVKSLEPGTCVLLIAPDYTLAGISWDLQQGFIKNFSIETDKNNAKDRVITLSNGSMIRVASVAKVDSAVGRSYDLILFDEAALNDAGKDAFNIALRPTLDKLQSKCIFISTPRGGNYFEEFYLRGFSSDFPDWISIHCDYRENPRALESEIDSARRSMSRAEFQQEYEANFCVFSGQVYNFSNECIQDLTPLKQRMLGGASLDTFAGLDIGFRDDTAMAVISLIAGDPDAVLEDGSPDFEARKDLYYCVGEYLENQVTTATQATAIKDLETAYGVDAIYIDSAAQQTRFDLAQIYDVSTSNAKKDVLAGINFCATLIENNQLIVDSSCTEVIFCLQNYRWDEKSQKEKTIHDKASHMADAIRYALYTHSLSSLQF